VISGRLELHGPGGERPGGLWMLLPVYHHGAPVATLAARRANIEAGSMRDSSPPSSWATILKDKEPLLPF